MKSEWKDNILTIYLSDHIDSNNADAVGAEIAEIRAPHEGAPLVIDCDELQYISSAGLRQILRLKKSCSELQIVNVAPEVYDVFEMTGFTEMIDITRGYRKLDVDNCEILGEGSNGIVYRYNADTIVKVYKNPDALDDIEHERELARAALVLGINTAIPYDVVKVGDRYASVFELLSSKSLSKWIVEDPDNKDKYIGLFVDFLKEVHQTEVKEGLLPDEKLVVLNWVSYLKDRIDEAHFNKLYSMVEAVPKDNHMIHGDFHTNNIHYDGEETIIIDMDTLAVGNPVFEMGSVYNAYQGFSLVDPGCVQKFLKIDFDTATYVWKKFLQLYYGKEDVALEEMRAKVVGLARLLRRTYRRDPDNTVYIEECRKQLFEAIDAVDSLV